jgi:hypothetical protein
MKTAVIDTGVFVAGVFWRHEPHLCLKALVLEKPFGIAMQTPRVWLGALTRPQRRLLMTA